MSVLLSSPQTVLEMRGVINLWPEGPVGVVDFSGMRPTGKATNPGRYNDYPLPTHEQFVQTAEANAVGSKFSFRSPNYEAT